ncbi:ABC transporter ATP-binding protein [Bifidobacterium aerophilum]|uniref:ABC transporter ATP-binding protein n=1 Tax=Bifidobacterium aerophilum TaxID=1798155 RepID=UPI003084183D
MCENNGEKRNDGNRLRPFRDAVVTSWRTSAYALRKRPVRTVVMWLSMLVMMAMPSLQVWMIGWACGPDGLGMGSALGTGRFALILVVLTVGAVLMSVSSSLAQDMRDLLQEPLMAEYQSDLTDALANLTPAQTLDDEVTAQVRAARDAIPYNVASQAADATSVVGALASMVMLAGSLWHMHPLAAVMIAVAMIPELLAQFGVEKLANELWPKRGKESRRANYFERLLDYPPSSTEIAATAGSFGIPAQARVRYFTMAGMWERVSWRRVQLTGVSSLAFALLTGGAFWLILTSGHAAATSIPAALVGIMTGLSVTRTTGEAFGNLMASTPMILAFDRLMDMLHANHAIPETAGPVGVHVEHLTYAYPVAVKSDGEDDDADDAHKSVTAVRGPALDDVSLDIAPGSIVALVGENGSGKTTLVKLIAGILDAPDGAVGLTSGKSGDGHCLDSWAERLGASSMVFQDFTHIEVTVREFIDPASRHTDEELRDGLRRARALDIVNALPDGLDTQLGQEWGGVGLSGGQWQRLALACTFLSGKPLWILDEPTAAVDATAEAAICYDLIANRPADTTVIVISHRPRVLTDMDRIIVLDHGRIGETGTYRQLVDRNGAFARLTRDSLE